MNFPLIPLCIAAGLGNDIMQRQQELLMLPADGQSSSTLAFDDHLTPSVPAPRLRRSQRRQSTSSTSTQCGLRISALVVDPETRNLLVGTNCGLIVGLNVQRSAIALALARAARQQPLAPGAAEVEVPHSRLISTSAVTVAGILN